jgi:hypothetical protein
MTEPAAAAQEWDQLVVKVGKLTLAAGILEMAIITIACRVLGRREAEVSESRWRSNKWWCEKLLRVAPASWSTATEPPLAARLLHVRELYKRRNRAIHSALGLAADNSIAGVPAGSIVDLRSYGIGFTSQTGNTWAIGIVGKRVRLQDIDDLTEQIHAARLGLVPFMELADRIKHPAKPFPTPEVGGRL